MDTKVVVRHGQVPAEIQQTIKQKVSRLPRFFERTTAIEVICDLEHSGQPNVEIRISAEERNDFFASDTGSNVLAALDSVVDKIERQMRRHKEKTTEHHRGRNHQPEE